MPTPKNDNRVAGSFRDPSGFLFFQDEKLFRQVNHFYQENYDHLIDSGLYDQLVKKQYLVPHKEVDQKSPWPDAYKVIEPEAIPFISYPYEWCFSQLKDAALLTFHIQKTAMEFGMTLKDCSAYNVQFADGRPVFIDTLSFEKYEEGQIWVPYRQACQHFIAPLALMCYTDQRLSQLLRTHLDGIPLDLASALLPFKARFNPSLFSHIFLHARSQKHFAHKKVDTKRRRISRMAFMGLVESLLGLVKNMHWRPEGTEWAAYYEDTNYSTEAFSHKKEVAQNMLEKTDTAVLWDLGANDGMFSRIASEKGIYTLSFDIDYSAVEKNYVRSRSHGEKNILPLLLDLANPSPGIGWESSERMSIIQRGPAHTVFAFALVHHLAISNNLPLEKIAHFLYQCCTNLIIEFVPKSDSQVQRLLATREDIFTDYSQQHFEKEFSKYFHIRAHEPIRDSKRIMYLMKKKAGGP